MVNFDDFMKLGDIKYVRYHFGLETSEGHGANRIRVILFPVGKDLTKLAVSGANDVMQYSWPPVTDGAFISTEEEYIDASALESVVII